MFPLEEFSHQFVDLYLQEIHPDVLGMVPLDLAAQGVIPVTCEGDVLIVAVSNPLDSDLSFERIRFVCDREIRMVVATEAGIAHALKRYYPIANPR